MKPVGAINPRLPEDPHYALNRDDFLASGVEAASGP